MAKGKVGMTLSCVKCVVVVINAFFLILGTFILAGGIMGLTHPSYSIDNVDVPTTKALYIASIVLGSFVVVTSCCGCCGAMLENKCMLCMYWLILLLLIGGQLAVGGVAYKHYEDGGVSREKLVQESWKNADNKEKEAIMKDAHCCGFEKYNDTPNVTCPAKAKKPCEPVINGYIKDSLRATAISILTVAGIELVGFLFSFCLLCFLPGGKYSDDDDASRPLVRSRDPVPAYQGSYSGRRA